MNMEKRGFVERTLLKAGTVVGLAGLALSGCGDDKESGTVPDQLKGLHAKATQLCTEQAEAKFVAEYPDVEIGDNPTRKDLQNALDVLDAKESEGPEFMQGEFDDCMEINFDNVVNGLDNGTIVPIQVTETTAGN